MQKDKKAGEGKSRQKAEGQTPSPMKKADISSNPDAKINQDFPGHPHAPADEKIINPSTSNEKEISDIDNKDGEKRNYHKK